MSTTARSVYGGSIMVSYQGSGEAGADALLDSEVLGNVSFSYGGSAAVLDLDGAAVRNPW